MRAICLFGLLTTLCFTSAAGAQVQDPAESRRMQELLDRLREYDISVFGPDPVAFIPLRNANSLKGAALLRDPGLKLEGIRVDVKNAELFEQFLKLLVQFKELKELSVEFSGITDAQAKQLEVAKSLKNLKTLRLRYANLSPRSVEQMKANLWQLSLKKRE